MSTERKKLSDQIRLAIDASGLSRYRVCKTIGISESTMSRFMSGHSGLSLRVLDDLADLLNMNITTPKRAKKRKEQ